MKVLLTGATRYIGKRILPVLVQDGHHVVCCVRDKSRFNITIPLKENISVLEADLTDRASLLKMPADIDAAYYLVHSMADSARYEDIELQSASNFREALSKTQVKHVIYLSGIVNESELSRHLLSRKMLNRNYQKAHIILPA